MGQALGSALIICSRWMQGSEEVSRGLFLPTPDISFLVERAPPVYHHLCLHLLRSIPSQEHARKSLASTLPTQSRHCPLLAAPGLRWGAGAPKETSAFPLACDSGEVSGSHCPVLTSGMRCPHAHWFKHILQGPLQLGLNTAFLSLCIFLLPCLHWFRTWPGKRGLIWGAPLNPNLHCAKEVKVGQSCSTLWDPMENSPG